MLMIVDDQSGKMAAEFWILIISEAAPLTGYFLKAQILNAE